MPFVTTSTGRSPGSERANRAVPEAQFDALGVGRAMKLIDARQRRPFDHNHRVISESEDHA